MAKRCAKPNLIKTKYILIRTVRQKAAPNPILSQQNSITDVNFYQPLTSIYPQPRGRTHSP